MKLKLYTEEQVIDAISMTRDGELIENEIINRLILIELPSDEEMANASNHCKDGQVKIGFLRGVLWYQEQILNQNK